jgi:hypothetical protein
LEFDAPMVQELLPHLPDALTTPQTLCALAGVIAGVFLWLTGSAWSRGIVTLVAVAAGAMLGLYVPRWQIWPVNPMGTSVLGAVVFGMSAFLGERLWIGIVLGCVLAAWVTFGTWMIARPPDFVWQERADWEVQNFLPPEYARDVYERLPADVQKVLPYAAGTAVLCGLGLSLLFPRAGRVACMSVVGVTMMFLCGLALTAVHRADWLKHVPAPPVSQAATLAGLVLVGLLAQWQFSMSKEVHKQQERNREREHEAAIDRQMTRMFT